MKKYPCQKIEVRIGGIYALERIAQDSVKYDLGRDHIRVMQILCAYIRENSPAFSLELTEPPFQRKPPRIDVQAAIDILGKRDKLQLKIECDSKFRLDLCDCDLSFITFSGGNFSAAKFHRSRLEGAIFDGCDLIGTQFHKSLLNFASFFDARMVGTRMDYVTLNRPIPTIGTMSESITLANIHSVSFIGADISAIDYLGEADQRCKTFGTSDTILNHTLEEFRYGLKSKQMNLRKAIRNGDEIQISKSVSELDETGLRYWCDFKSTDMAVGHSWNKYMTAMDLTGWPHN